MQRPFALLSFLLLFMTATANPLFVRGVEASDTDDSWDTGIETRTLDEIYAAAKRENTPCRVAWGGDVAQSGDRITDAFKKRFPGIELQLTVDVSKYLDSKADRAIHGTSGKDEAFDVAVIQTLHDFVRWKSEGRLLHYKVAPWNDLHPEFADPDGAYTGYAIFTFGETIYNPNKYVNTSLPTHYPDFLNPIYAGKLALTYPNDDDSILYLFTLITEKYGFKFVEQLIATQDVTWFRGTASPSLAIMADNSTNNPLSISFASSHVYVPTVGYRDSDDVYMAWPQTAAIFKNTKAPETAKLFLSYIMGDEWQARVTAGGYATRKSFDKKKILEQTNVDPRGYMKFMMDRAAVERWRFQFESLIGTAQGPDPLQLKLN